MTNCYSYRVDNLQIDVLDALFLFTSVLLLGVLDGTK